MLQAVTPPLAPLLKPQNTDEFGFGAALSSEVAEKVLGDYDFEENLEAQAKQLAAATVVATGLRARQVSPYFSGASGGGGGGTLPGGNGVYDAYIRSPTHSIAQTQQLQPPPGQSVGGSQLRQPPGQLLGGSQQRGNLFAAAAAPPGAERKSTTTPVAAETWEDLLNDEIALANAVPQVCFDFVSYRIVS